MRLNLLSVFNLRSHKCLVERHGEKIPHHMEVLARCPFSARKGQRISLSAGDRNTSLVAYQNSNIKFYFLGFL